jgi:hypothetical protein
MKWWWSGALLILLMAPYSVPSTVSLHRNLYICISTYIATTELETRRTGIAFVLCQAINFGFRKGFSTLSALNFGFPIQDSLPSFTNVNYVQRVCDANLLQKTGPRGSESGIENPPNQDRIKNQRRARLHVQILRFAVM